MELKFFTINEVAECLHVSRSTVNRLLASGQLQASKIRRSVRIPMEAINALKDQQARKETDK